MAKLKKTMCKYSKEDFREMREDILAEVASPRYVCKKCLRTARRKELLCKPEEIESPGSPG